MAQINCSGWSTWNYLLFAENGGKGVILSITKILPVAIGKALEAAMSQTIS